MPPNVKPRISYHRDEVRSPDELATPDEFVKILRQAGFGTISPIRLMLGSVILYTARRD